MPKARSQRHKRKAAKRSKGPTARRQEPMLRLGARVKPRAYRVRVELDPERSRRYRGSVEIDLEVLRSCDRFELHAADQRVSAASVQMGTRKLRATLVPHPHRETIEIVLQERLKRGDARLSLRFSSQLRSDLRGLYYARSGTRSYAFTQLEAADARRFFPCFDEPSFKARFTLSVTTAKHHTVISNSPVDRQEALQDGRQTTHFCETPRLSTYLVALGVGALVSSSSTWCGPTEIRVWHVPGNEHLTGFALETARESLARLEKYFAVPYPYDKLDLVAVPDFEIGAMENAGAVFFRETLLLVNPDTVTIAEKKRAAEVICHELAHMWYGNLVTMTWWDDLWLNEAFATWMAFHIVDQWQPQWKMWNDFGHSANSAMQLDALRNTHPIYTRVKTPDEATENFDLITYEKGAAVIRMLERYLGPRTFRKGVRRYIRAHAEGNAVASDLWNALAEASEQSVDKIMRAWVQQPGFPLVRVRHTRAAGQRALELVQEPFSANGKPSQRPRAASARWPVPWVGRVGGGRGFKPQRHLLTKKRDRVVLDGRNSRFIYGNAEEAGFFRPLHEGPVLEALVAHFGELRPIERMGLIGHQWALVASGYQRIESFLPIVSALSDEQDPDVLFAAQGPVEHVLDLLAPQAGDQTAALARAWIARTFEPGFQKLGWTPGDGEADGLRQRRAALLQLTGVIAEAPRTLDEAEARCRAYLADTSSVESNLADAVVVMGARAGDQQRFDAYLGASREAPTPQERRRFRMALGEFPQPALVKRAVALCLSDDIPTQDVALLLARLLGNRRGRTTAWGAIKRRWSSLQRRIPAMLMSRVIEATTWLPASYRPEVAEFFKSHPVPSAARALRQTLERFRLNEALGKREAPELRCWLENQVPPGTAQ